jgi:hypothetical protein
VSAAWARWLRALTPWGKEAGTGKKRSLSCEGVRGLKGVGWPPEEEKRKKASDKSGGGLGC